MTPWLTVVGIGEDGFKGLGKNARHALLGASRIIGGQRQLDLLPRLHPWRTAIVAQPVLPGPGTGAARRTRLRTGQRRSDVLRCRRQPRPATARSMKC